jgi:hypothetical protein
VPKRSEPKKTIALIQSNNKKHNPILMTLDEKESTIENFFTRRPESTEWATKYLGGASLEELDQYAPVDEKQLRAIFPGAVATKMVDPLSTTDKIRIHENVRRDGGTKLALSLLSYFMLGKNTTISLGLPRRYANKDRENKALQMIQNNDTYLDMLEEIMNRDDDLDMIQRQIALIASAHAFGRAVMVRQYDGEGFPKRYIPLSSARLGRWWVNRKDWQPLGVEYKDYTKSKRILLIKDIVHYEVDDWHITPNSLYYGMSTAENVIAIGERNRVANETSMPEIIKSLWAPIMLVKTTGPRSAQKMREIISNFKRGKTIFYNDDIEITVIPLTHDLEKLNLVTKDGEKAILRAFTVPIGTAFEDDPNRATLEKSLEQWYNGPLKFKRSQFDQVMWKQHYKPQVEKMMPVGEEIPFRIETQFENIRIDSFLDTSSALLGWVNAGLINGDIARTEANLGKYNDDMNAEALKKVTLGNNMVTQEMEMDMQGQGIQGVNPATGPAGKGLPTGQIQAS